MVTMVTVVAMVTLVAIVTPDTLVDVVVCILPAEYCCTHISYLVVMFSKEMQQADISFITCACPSIFMKQFCSLWTDFEEILYWMLLLNFAYKIQVSAGTKLQTIQTFVYFSY